LEQIRYDKRAKVLFLTELVLLCIYVITKLGGQRIYEFNAQNMEIYYQNVVYMEEEGAYYIHAENKETAEAYPVIGIAKMDIAPGAYEIEIQYDSQTNPDAAMENCANETGFLQIRSYNNPTSVKYNTISLVDGHTVQKDRMWITSLTHIEDLDFKVYFNGIGTLKIEKIALRELPVWRFTCILKWVLILLFIDFCYFYFIRKNDYADKHIIFCFICMVIFASLPVFQDFVIGGHDLPFHLSRILSLGRSIAEGRWLPAIQTDMMNGYGYASPLFYGQLFLYIPAILYNMAVPIHTCYQIYVLCVNIATCAICYGCIKGICGNKNIALFGSFVYLFSAYRLSNVYVRAAVGEYTAMVFMPMIVYGFYKIYTAGQEKICRKDYICVALGLTGVVQSHMIATELSAVFIVITCVALCKKTFQPQRFLALVKAALLTVLLNLGFLWPMLDSMQMNIHVKAHGSEHMQESGAYLLQVFGVFMTPSGKSIEEIKGDMPINLGFGLVAGVAVFCWCFCRRFDWKLEKNALMKTGAFFVSLAALAIVCSLQVFPWDSLGAVHKRLANLACVIQFPWRYLSIATVLCVFITVIGISILCQVGKTQYGIAAGGIIGGFLLLNAGLFYMQYADDSIITRIYAATSDAETITNVYGGEYLLDGTQNDLCLSRDLILEDDTVTASDYRSQKGKFFVTCANGSSDSKRVELPLFHYDHYQAYDQESGETIPIETGSNNRIALLIPADYNGNICVEYVVPLLWKVAYLVSMVTAISIILWCMLGHRLQVRRE